MKRDMDQVRKILLACEQHEHGRAPANLQIEGSTAEQGIGVRIDSANSRRNLNQFILK